MSEREHARLAGELIDACGGLDEAVRASGLSKGTLSRYQGAHYPDQMPPRVINLLECYCGRPIYSAALFDFIDTPTETGALKDLACDLAETAAGVQALIRKALADGRLTPRELTEIAGAEAEAEEALNRLRGARLAAEAGTNPDSAAARSVGAR